jgi:hypothetical protein
MCVSLCVSVYLSLHATMTMGGGKASCCGACVCVCVCVCVRGCLPRAGGRRGTRFAVGPGRWLASVFSPQRPPLAGVRRWRLPCGSPVFFVGGGVCMCVCEFMSTLIIFVTSDYSSLRLYIHSHTYTHIHTHTRTCVRNVNNIFS